MAASGPETIFALSSGRPPAAIAVIRSSGQNAFTAAERIAGALPPLREARLCNLREPHSGELIDRGLVVRFAAPASATGEDLVEYHCHGSRAVVDALLVALASIDGLRPAAAGEFTRRALANGRIDLTEAEGLADLLAAETESQRRSAMAMAGGALRQQVERWQDGLLQLAARAEAAIDYDDEADVSVAVDLLLDEMGSLAAEIDSWLARPPAERLRDGVRVVVAGPVNAGKSSLFNALVGDERAIVTHIAGTTRDSIEMPLALAGVPLLLVDTAGDRDSGDLVESIGIARARAEVDRADLVLWLGDAEAAPLRGGVILVGAKADLGHTGKGLPVSAKTGAGLDQLVRVIVDRAVALLPQEGEVALNRRQRQLLGEAQSLLAVSAAAPLELIAESLRLARNAFHRLTGQAGVEQVLDALFARFCVGK